MDEQQRIIDVASSSSNSSAPVSSKKYDVFLSFRGVDTRLNFTSHLHNALIEAQIETFIDNRLETGDEISEALIKAIEDSHISVVIFSENYATSKWCLNELSKIMEFKKKKEQIVIPVFYNVDPTHVRYQTGCFKEAFAKHEGHPMYCKWKAALTDAANLSGWHHSQNRTEVELLKGIVQDVLQKLARAYPNQLKNLVGIEESYKEVESLLKIDSSEVITLGIWGMGGMGKTTLAKALFHKLSHKFEGRCFLANVSEKSSNVEGLRKELLSMLLEEEKNDFNGLDMSRLRRKRVLIVLDDVSTSEQLEKLITENNFLREGSRNKQLLKPRNMHEVNEIYPIEKLNSDSSLELFCLTVFGDKQPKPGYEDLSRKVISYCKGVPLALKVLGSSLRDRNEKAWEDELKKLQKIPNMEIHNVLKLSFDGLDHSQKDIFLDIACFFKGKERDWVTGLLEAFDFFPASGIEVLLDKALITISNTNQIEMHDLIQEMGQKIVYQESEKHPRKRSRLWKHEDVLDVLKNNKGTDVVEGVILYLYKLNEDLTFSSDSLAKMTNVRFFKIHGDMSHQCRFNVHLTKGLRSLSDKLRYLHWDSCCLVTLPPNFCAEQLVELHMRFSSLKKLWDGVQDLVNLKTIDLTRSRELVEIPNLSKAEKLEKLNLSFCESLHQIDPSILSLPKLTYLNLSNCVKIESLKSIVPSKSLCVLIVDECSSLKEFSVTSQKITKLSLSGTALCELLPSIGQLVSLENLSLRGTNVEILPANMKKLSMLTRLNLDVCRELVSLPELPPSLRELRLNYCSKLVSLPELPPSLRELHLNSCWKLMSLPELPPTLIQLDLNNCQKLVYLSKLPPTLTSKLSLNNCRKLVFLPELPPTLIELQLNNCRKLVSLPELPPSLRKLHLFSCWKLVSLPKLSPSLSELYLNNCWKLEFLPELPASLTTLYLNDCRKLMSLPNLPLSVKCVSAFNCTSMEIDTQGLVLQHMSQNLIPNVKCHTMFCDSGFIFPGDHVTNECGFHTMDRLITISYIPKPDLLGFICYVILSKDRDLHVPDDDGLEDVSDDDGSESEDDDLKYDGGEYHHMVDHLLVGVYDDALHDDDGSKCRCWGDEGNKTQKCHGNIRCQWPDTLIGDHVFSSYVDICKIHTKMDLHDQFHEVTFDFEFSQCKGGMKGCGVFPVYATTSGLKLVSDNMTLARPRARAIGVGVGVADQKKKIGVGVGGSNNENNKFFNENQLLKFLIITIFIVKVCLKIKGKMKKH